MQIILEKIEVYGYLILYFFSFGGSFLGIMGAGILSSFGKLDLMPGILIVSCGFISGRMILAYVSCWFRGYGGYAFLLSKYIYAIKSLVPIAIGLSSYPLWKFWLWNTGASLLWGVIMGCVGYFASEAIVQALQNQWGYVLASIAICGAFVGILIAKRRFNARRTSCIQ